MSQRISPQPIDPAALLAEVASPGCGANTLFLGTVRRSPEDGDVEGIDYSAYPEMAESEFARLIAEARARWPEARIAIQHRIGFIPTGEASIGIAVAAPHRAEAYECSRFLIEETKVRVPVWKKEHLAHGERRWAEPGVDQHVTP